MKFFVSIKKLEKGERLNELLGRLMKRSRFVTFGRSAVLGFIQFDSSVHSCLLLLLQSVRKQGTELFVAMI